MSFPLSCSSSSPTHYSITCSIPSVFIVSFYLEPPYIHVSPALSLIHSFMSPITVSFSLSLFPFSLLLFQVLCRNCLTTLSLIIIIARMQITHFSSEFAHLHSLCHLFHAARLISHPSLHSHQLFHYPITLSHIHYMDYPSYKCLPLQHVYFHSLFMSQSI